MQLLFSPHTVLRFIFSTHLSDTVSTHTYFKTQISKRLQHTQFNKISTQFQHRHTHTHTRTHISKQFQHTGTHTHTLTHFGHSFNKHISAQLYTLKKIMLSVLFVQYFLNIIYFNFHFCLSSITI